MEKKNRNGRNVMAAFLTVSLAAGILGGCGQTAADTADAKEVEITNVSYDPTRELYEAYSALFAEHWKAHLGEYEIVVSSVSILCQPTVALVDEVVDDRGTREVATEYLEYLYSTEAQKLEAENFYRPLDQEVYVDYVSTAGSASSRNCRQTENGSWMILHSQILHTLADGVRRRQSISRTAACLTRFMNSD